MIWRKPPRERDQEKQTKNCPGRDRNKGEKNKTKLFKKKFFIPIEEDSTFIKQEKKKNMKKENTRSKKNSWKWKNDGWNKNLVPSTK